LILALCFPVQAQQRAEKAARISYLGNEQSPSASPREKAFLQGLRDHGWIEGQNMVIERRYWENRADRLPALAKEMVRLNVDIIVTTTGTAALAVKKATRTIPIVMTASADAVTQGLVASLARPRRECHRVNQYFYRPRREATRTSQGGFPEGLACGCTVLSGIRRIRSQQAIY
jgi:ABC-type uncharacterized transport system substrate-binding protein